MRIRRYEPDDLSQITALFYDPVHAVNAADYAPEMKCHRHPYQRGISARKGIEY